MATKKPTAAAKKALEDAAKAAAANVNIDLLKLIETATMSPTGCMYVGENAKALADAGYIEVNTEMRDTNGNVAARITPKGQEYMATNAPAAAPAAATAATKSGFKIVSGIAPPAGKRGATGDKKYPFDALEVGQAFFVPAGPDFDPVKRLGSTVSSATARYAVEVPGETRVDRNGATVPKTKATRKFVMRAIEDGKDFGAEFAGVAGAGIFRVADGE